MEKEYSMDDQIYFNKPSLVLRIKSTLIDSLVIILLMLVMSSILGILKIESGMLRGICFALVILYEPILVTFGGTIGQRIMGLRVRNFYSYSKNKSTHNINIFYSLIRYFMKILLGWISLLTIHSDNYGQAIHDKTGGSVMTFK